MRFLHPAAALAAMLPLAGCNLAQAPIDMTKRMFQAGGRTIGLGAFNARKPGDFKIDSAEVRSALAASRPAASPAEPAAATVVAGR